jgi:hypothetical protein
MYTIAATTRHEHWGVEMTDANVFAELVDDVIKTKGKKTKAAKMLIENLPVIALLAVLAALLGPRIEASYEIVRQRKGAHAAPGHQRDGGVAIGLDHGDAPPISGSQARHQPGAVRTAVGDALAEFAATPLVS